MRIYCVAALVAAVFASGCEPARQMRVREGQSPEYLDKNVRFRTTYYFRTFDYCYGKEFISGQPNTLIVPETDSLFRFRMTGKASALLTKVLFESGTLSAAQIEPFGAKVVDDGENGFRFVSAEEIARRADKKEAAKEIDELLSVLEKLAAAQGANQLSDEYFKILSDATAAAMQDSINVMAGNKFGGRTKPPKERADEEVARAREINPDVRIDRNFFLYRGLPDFSSDYPSAANASGEESTGDDAAIDGETEIGCGKNGARRGFQIMGPEGWRTFNQDERLLMAMSTSDAPLVSVLQQYADRVLTAKGDVIEAERNLGVEALKVLRAERAFDRAQLLGDEADKAFAQAISDLGEVAGVDAGGESQ